MGLSKSVPNGEVTVLPGRKLQIFGLVEINMGLSKIDHNGEVTLLVR